MRPAQAAHLHGARSRRKYAAVPGSRCSTQPHCRILEALSIPATRLTGPDVFGFAPGAFNSGAFVPRLLKSWTTRDLSGISLPTYGLFTAGPAGGPVKKSKSGICHAPQSASYQSVKNFTAFPTLDACLASGGRLPQPPGH
jgi:hypothetical protein